MKAVEYINDKCLLLLLHFALMALLAAFLLLTGYPLDNCIVVLLCWGAVLLCWLLLQFFTRRRYFQMMENVVENLDERYLLGELMPKSFRLDDRLYRALIQKSNKSVIERIRRVEDAQKEYREYIESWVHEVKAPITNIALHCENHFDERARYVAAENQKIENYVDMALYYARLDEVYKDYLIAETDLSVVAGDVLMKNKRYLISCGIQAFVDCPDPAFTDKKWIAFILNQLVLNSAKYRRDQGAFIRIFTQRTKSGVALKVADNGIGIKPEELPRIFDKGFTGTNGRQTERSTGIGLYLCSKLCKKLGVSIWAKSVQGEGTQVALEFPVSAYFSGFRK